jgi:hypothetical protein
MIPITTVTRALVRFTEAQERSRRMDRSEIALGPRDLERLRQIEARTFGRVSERAPGSSNERIQ